MLTDTVVGPWVDVVTTGTKIVVSTDETVVPVTVVVTGEVPVVVDSTEVGGCVTTVVPVIGDVCSVVVTSVTVGLVVLTDTVGCFGVVLELTVVVPIYTIQLKFVRKLKRTYNPARAGRDLFH